MAYSHKYGMTNAYIIKCETCSFTRWSDGSEESFADLRPVTLCPKCKGPRNFKCPGCGFVVKARRWVEPPLPSKHHFMRD